MIQAHNDLRPLPPPIKPPGSDPELPRTISSPLLPPHRPSYTQLRAPITAAHTGSWSGYAKANIIAEYFRTAGGRVERVDRMWSGSPPEHPVCAPDRDRREGRGTGDKGSMQESGTRDVGRMERGGVITGTSYSQKCSIRYRFKGPELPSARVKSGTGRVSAHRTLVRQVQLPTNTSGGADRFTNMVMHGLLNLWLWGVPFAKSSKDQKIRFQLAKKCC